MTDMSCMKFAREHNLLVSVRGGGHSIAGMAMANVGRITNISNHNPQKGVTMKKRRRGMPVQLAVVLVLALLILNSCEQQLPTVPVESGAAIDQLAKVDGTTRFYLLGEEPIEGPDKTVAANGDTIILTGSGTLTPMPKAVTGGGTFVHKNSSGSTLGSGTWTATQLITFVSYGTLPPPDDNLEGGKANVRVHLSPSGGGELDAILQIHCLLGAPPPGASEGIRLNVQDVINFNREVHGETVFIKLP